MEPKNKLNPFTAIVIWDAEMKLYFGQVPQVPGAYTQAATLDELKENLKEVLELCLEDMDEEEVRELPQVVGLQMIDIGDR